MPGSFRKSVVTSDYALAQSARAGRPSRDQLPVVEPHNTRCPARRVQALVV